MGVIFGEALMISIDRYSHIIQAFIEFIRCFPSLPVRPSARCTSSGTPGVGWIMDYGGGECWAYTNELNGAGLGGLGWLFERAVRALRDNSLEIASEIMILSFCQMC